jgi:hypothetical protein
MFSTRTHPRTTNKSETVPMVSIGDVCIWTAAMLVLLEGCFRYRSCCDGPGHARVECIRCGVIDVYKGVGGRVGS